MGVLEREVFRCYYVLELFGERKYVDIWVLFRVFDFIGLGAV